MEAERVIIIAGKVANHASLEQNDERSFCLEERKALLDKKPTLTRKCLEERKVVLMAPA